MSAILNPPVTDELPVAIRAYAAQTFSAVPDTDGAKPKASRKAAIAPASGRLLIFDTETTSDAAQSLRFGTYQYRQGDVLDESGIFYDPEGVTAAELTTLRTYADANGLTLRTREAFVDEVFFAQAYQHRATIVGFHLPFDISRLAIRHGTARTPLDSESATMRGAFTFALSHQKIYPNVRVKHMSQKAASISFAAPMRQPDGRGHRNRGLKTGIRRGHFVDVKTLANAIFARGFSLSSLSRFLAVPNPKLDFDDFAGPVTEDMVRYAVRDVQATWECYAELVERFGKLNLTRTIPEKVYSEASIGKGYIREMGIMPWRKAQPDIPRDILARTMASYFGGRSEVRIRREIRQVMLCDFLSMYPTVCTLLGLWRFVIADGMTWRDATEETRTFLDRIDLDTLQSQPVWAQFTTLVRVLPDADIFPVRAGYENEIHTTIGANYLSSEWPMWFTLADCVAAKLLTGKAPEIVEAMTFAPGPVQSGLRPIDIAGNPDYGVDPVTTDFFKRVIELRQSIKRDMKDATGDEHVRLDTEQHALKICANSTSYGIWVEVNVETRPFRKQLTVHSAMCAPYSFRSDKAEIPGTYFHPLLATLITGAARLMLAITERLIIDQGLDWAFCDTDSMAIAKPDNMGADEFLPRCTAVVDWFAALNPYNFGGSILKIEDVNASLATDMPEPLHCLAISSKRYALYNLAADGRPIMRKVSAHGLGHLLPPYRADAAPAELPVPHKSVLGNGIERWHCDLWYQIIVMMLGGKPDQVQLDYHPALGNPAISRYAATSPELLAWFKAYNASRLYRDQVKPFGFLLSMSEAFGFGEERPATAPTRGRPKKARKLKPIAPFDSDLVVAVALVFDRDGGKPIAALALKSYAEALAHYHLSPESKFLNADYDDRGTTVRRHVRMTETRHIGKESHDWERQAALGLSRDSEVAYGVAVDDIIKKLPTFVAEFGERQAAKALGISAARLRALASGGTFSGRAKAFDQVASRLSNATSLCRKLRDTRQADLLGLVRAVESDGLRETARQLGTDPSNLRRRLSAVQRGVVIGRAADIEPSMKSALSIRDSEIRASQRDDIAVGPHSLARTVLSRSVRDDQSVLKLSDGSILTTRRFLPVGQGDTITQGPDSLAVLVKRDDLWLEMGPAWSTTAKIDMSGIELAVTFKEIETSRELALFQQLRQFHYRGGGGAGRILPLIGTVDAPDLPRVIGFVELTSSMIANTARKRFFDGPYREPTGLGWSSWDRDTSRELSSLICRISRFVIHPELRGLGLARYFAKAAIGFANDRWHYGGYRPRFLEITADMLRYYPFVSKDFANIGETEGNQHRVSKDMSYLVRRALSDEGIKAMPQGGGGIMSLQRGYATTLLDYIHQSGDSLEQAVAQLQYDPSVLDQQSWEKLHRLNRRPKPCYVAGLTESAREYVATRTVQMSANVKVADRVRTKDNEWKVNKLSVDVEADIVQSRDGRLLQDAFGFVGSSLGSVVVPPIDLTVRSGQISLVCGASGAGKSLFLLASEKLLSDGSLKVGSSDESVGLNLSGTVDRHARIATFANLDPNVAPLDLLGTAPLSKMLMLAARCGLAEPQLLVRPIWTLSSGQRYRLQIALALLRDPEVIIIDNFCESLDRFSTRAVCKGLSTLIRQLNIGALLATAAYDRLTECLKPDQVIMLRRGDEPVIRKGFPLEI